MYKLLARLASTIKGCLVADLDVGYAFCTNKVRGIHGFVWINYWLKS